MPGTKKDEERQEKEVTDKLKTFMMRKEQGDFLYLRRHWLVFEAQDLNLEWYMNVAAGIQNAIHCYCVIYGEK